MNTLFEAPWLADLTTELPPNVRLQRLIGGLRAHFAAAPWPCCGWKKNTCARWWSMAW